MKRSLRFGVPFLVLALGLLLRCAHNPPAVSGKPLELAHDAPAAPPTDAFAVAFAGPKGPTQDPSEVTLVFNRPLAPLELAESSPPAPAKILAGDGHAPGGVWRWMGTRALVFVPDGHLPLATEYAVTVPAGTRALSGETLAQPYELTFSTPRPRLERLTSKEDERHLIPGSAFDARFNQPIDPAEVQRVASISTRGAKGRPMKVVASRPDPKNKRLVHVVPASPLPLGRSIEVRLDASMKGNEGPLPMGTDSSTTFDTYGPLHLVAVRCESNSSSCDPGGDFQVELSNAVSLEQLRAHLRISPAVRIEWPTGVDETQPSTIFSVTARLLPGRSHTITVGRGLRDGYGQTMVHDEHGAVQVNDLPPNVAVGLSGAVLEPAAGVSSVAVSSVNVPEFTLATGALDERQVARLLESEPGENEMQPNGPSAFERLRNIAGIVARKVHTNAKSNAVSTERIALGPLLAPHGGRGAFVIATERPEHESFVRQVKVAGVTNLGITAKLSRFGSLVWVTHLSDGRPVAQASVSIVDASSTIYRMQTDADGFAVIPAASYAAVNDEGKADSSRIVVAREGTDWTWRRVEHSGLKSDVWVDPSGNMAPFGMLFSDRGVYRPGETLKLDGIFRVPETKGISTPAGRSIFVHATDSEGGPIFDGRGILDPFGAIALDVPLPATAHLGEAAIEARLGDDKGEAAARLQVKLAAYKPSELKATVEARAREWTRGDRASFDVRGDYLFGAPMAGAQFTWNVTRARTAFAPPGADDLTTDDSAYFDGLPDRTPNVEHVQHGEGSLDARGVSRVTFGLDLAGPPTPESVALEAELQDISRQTVAASARAIVHPASFYVGLRAPSSLLLDPGTAPMARVVAIEPSGRHRAGVAVHVTLVRRTWTSVLEATGDNSGHWDSRAIDANVSSCDVRTGLSEATCSLAQSGAGFYLVRAVAKDERGRAVAASYPLYVLGEGQATGWRTTDNGTLDVVPDKKQYEVGDVAHILVKSPVRDADALFTVERAGIYRQERVHLSGSMPMLSVPITEDLRPNAYVAIHLVRGRTRAAPAHGADLGAPTYKVGHAQLLIDPESRRLKVAVKPANKNLGPGEFVDADIAVTDRQGAPAHAELTAWAVDEGVLMLTNYATPDPLPVFTAPRPLAVVSLESRADLAHLMLPLSELGIDKGNDGGGGGTSMRTDFRATAWFQAGIVTGPDGRVHVRFKLPDTLTTTRLMAVAIAQDDRFGFGDTRLVTSKPLMLRPALPRFLRAGDSLDAGVIVSTKGLAASQVTVSVEADGLALADAATRQVQVPAGGGVELRWPMTAPHVGNAKLAFRARAGNLADGVEVTRRVDAPTTLEAVAMGGDTRDVAFERFGNLSAMRDDTGGLEVRVASTALLGVGDGIEQLLEYPYGCTEQLTSRLVPLVVAQDMARDFDIALPKGPDADVAIAKILANQLGDGGFGWWPDSTASEPWVTAYALWGLDAAKKVGRPVPKEAIERAASWLHEQLSEPSNLEARWLSLSAFVLDVLATVGAPDPGAISGLYDSRQELSLEARALLAHAALTAKMAPSIAADLMRDLEAHLRITNESATVADNVKDGYAPELKSNISTTSIVLRTLEAVDPKSPMAPRLARGVLAGRDRGRWRNTQEAAWALIALDDYRKKSESATPNFDAHVSFADDHVLDAPFHGRSAASKVANIPVSKLLAHPDAPLSFQVDGAGELFYEARLRYALREAQATPLDRGFFVRKLVRSVKANDLAGAIGKLPTQTEQKIPAGSLVLVDVVVVTPSPRDQVVVDDPLPAGLEPIDSSLATTAGLLSIPGQAADEEAGQPSDDDAVASGSGWATAPYHREMHDDRVLTFVEHMPAGMYHYVYLARATTLGSFVVPPTRVECMYEPEVFGRGAPSHLGIVAP